jgi:hypothetical protein
MALDGAGLGPSYSSAPGSSPDGRGKTRFWRYPFRFTFRIVKRSIAGVIRTVAFHPVSSLLVVLLVAVAGFLGYQDYNGGGLRSGGTSNPVAAASLAPSPAAENFIKGQTTFDAGLMWGSFSDNFKQQLSSRGTSQQTLQQQLDARKKAGAKVDQVQYGGGVKTADGSRVFMYVLTMEAPNNQGVAETHYVLTVDPTDKIVNVE